jgi:hypothetical protein
VLVRRDDDLAEDEAAATHLVSQCVLKYGVNDHIPPELLVFFFIFWLSVLVISFSIFLKEKIFVCLESPVLILSVYECFCWKEVYKKWKKIEKSLLHNKLREQMMVYSKGAVEVAVEVILHQTIRQLK